MNEYATSVNKETGEVKYVLTKSRNGEDITLEDVTMGSEDAENLKHMVR